MASGGGGGVDAARSSANLVRMGAGASTRRRGVRPSRNAVIALVAVWVTATALAIGIALALDDPTGAGQRDRARPIVAGVVVAPGQELTAGESALPPLALVLDTPPPARIAGLMPEAQVAVLRRRAEQRATPRRLVELGSALQGAGEGPAAEASYRRALQLDADNLAARVGLLMADGATGTEGLDRAARALRRLTGQRPRDQLVAFNQGWLAAYRRDLPTARTAWLRTVRLGGETRLGRTAGRLLEAIERGRAGGNP